MARWKGIGNGIRDLVLSVGGPEIGEENVKLCIEFALPHLKHHNFLDTNEKKVERSIQGIHDKLVIHNLQTKADLLKEYCELFLKGPLSKENDKGNTILHYSLLHLLLLTSTSPTEDNIQCGRVVTQQENPSTYQKFDWGAYLLEGEEDRNDLGSDVETDDDDDNDTFLDIPDVAATELDTNEADDVRVAKLSTDNGTNQSSLAVSPHTKGTFDVKDVFGIDIFQGEIDSHERISKSRKWLQDHVVPPYWSENASRSGSTDDSLNRSSRMLSDWNVYLSSSSCIDLTKNQSLLTEYQVIREILWMLNGFEDLFAFPWDGFRYCVNTSVVVSHLAESSLHHFLEEAATFGSMVKCIKEFIEAVSCRVLPFPEVRPEDGPGVRDLRTMFSFSTITQSHQAFSSALSSQLDDILSIVVELNRNVVKQDESMTLSRLMLTLEPQFKLLSILYYFLVEAVVRPLSSESSSLLPPSPSQPNIAILAKRFLESITKRTFSKIPRCFIDRSPPGTLSPSQLSPSKLTSHLLNTIYGCLMLTDQTAAFGDSEVSLILQVWMETCRPYLEMLDDWMKFGSFQDPCNEFFIKRNENWGSVGEQFWEVSVCIEQNKDTSFLFLEHVLKEIVVAGKSLKLLDTIATRKTNVGSRKQQNATSLYRLYSESLGNSLRSRDERQSLAGNNGRCDYDERSERSETDESENEDDSKDSLIDRFLGTFYSSPMVDEVFFKTLRKKLKETDPLLLLSALNSIKPHGDTNVEESKDNSRSSSTTTTAPETSSICSNFFFHLTLHKSLESFVQMRYYEASFELLNVIRNDCHLHQHLNSIKKYFLMESGRMMFDFYSALFRAMGSGVEWYEDGYLKFMLCESFSDERPEELDRITIVVKDLKEVSTNISCLESIVMDYKAPWPCDMVINSKSMARYCQIFQFLLQLKWAKYSLDCLRFSDLQISEAKKSLKHRMFIFKMSVLHFVNSFHNYIMTRILHSVGLEFQMKFDSARDFDELLFIHSCYLETIHDRCLLHEKVSVIKKCILKVLQMSLDISRMWKASVICEKGLSEMEVEYNRCIQFLSSMVSQVIARGSKAHLELLAFTFHSCLNSSKF